MYRTLAHNRSGTSVDVKEGRGFITCFESEEEKTAISRWSDYSVRFHHPEITLPGLKRVESMTKTCGT